MSSGRFRKLPGAVVLAAITLVLGWSSADAQQMGRLQGLVVDGTTNLALPGAQVVIEDLSRVTYTNSQGRYLFLNVPAGTYTVKVHLIGYAEITREVVVDAGQVTGSNFSLELSAIALGELVVTGVSGGAAERAKVPFTVARVDASQMPVAAVSALSQLQGRVPGANIAAISGRPGSTPQVILRGPTSINAEGRGQEPLYIVDGVLLGSGLTDINPADIESVEVVKGAAASTLYGSRAANGVISITTRRGQAEGVQFSVRSEIGFNDVERDFGIARFHPYLLDETGTRFCVLDPYGSSNVCSRTIDYRAEQERINSAPGDFAQAPPSFPVDPGAVTAGDILRRSFVAGNYTGQVFNAVEQLVRPKPLAINDISASGRFGGTTFRASLGHTRQGGAIMGLEGYERYNARINLGHVVGSHLTFDLTSYISRSTEDGLNQEEGGTGFFRLTRTPAIVDITKRDALGRLYIRTNLGSAGVQNENPLYSFQNIAREDVRWRYIGSGMVRYTPLEWLEADAMVSMDWMTWSFLQFNNRGFRTTNSNPGVNQGRIFNGTENSQMLGISSGLTFKPQLASFLSSRFNLSVHYDQQRHDTRTLEGNFLRVEGVRDARNATMNQEIASTKSSTRQMSLSAGSFFDLMDRYTFDFALRRDGNSRFGADNRWQTYGRASAAWLISRESWFPEGVVSAWTIRTSYGTSGNAPNFEAQYESFTIGTGGTLEANTLGNPKLRPEVVTELEIGTDIELFGRYGLTLAYANSLAKDQILPVPVAVSTGFPRQWQNAGELRNKTLEAALTMPIIQRSGLSWTSRLNYSTNSAIVEKLYVAPFFIGTNLQATQEIMRIEEGVRYGTFFGRKFMTSCNELPAEYRSQCGGPGSAFQRNDEGYLVWVGAGNNPRMGITDNLWNAVLPASQAPYGVQLAWGMPILVREDNGSPKLVELGHALPDHRVGMSHSIQYKRLAIFGLVEGAFGQSVWNQARHWSYLDFLSKDVDQGHKSVEDAKPIGYYYRAGPGPGGNPNGLGGFYDILGPNNRFVEDASFIKLRELSASYRVGSIGGFGDWTVSVIGRNLRTWTDYSGFDPEVGVGSSGGQSGSGLINAIDAFTFPQLRTFSFVLGTNF